MNKDKKIKEIADPYEDDKDNGYSDNDNYSETSGNGNGNSGHGNSNKYDDYSEPDQSNRRNEDSQPTSQKSRHEPSMKFDTLEQEKLYYLKHLKYMNEKEGITLSDNYSLRTSLDELKMEYLVQKELKGRHSAIESYKQNIVTLASCLQYLNGKFDPTSGWVNLNGWSESLSSDMTTLDEPLRKLYEKYKDYDDFVSPEIAVIMALVQSAMYHSVITNTFKIGAPFMNQAVASQPNLVSDLFSAGLNAAQMAKQAQFQQGSQFQQGQQSPKPYDISKMTGPTEDINGILSSFGFGNLPTSNVPVVPNPEATRENQDPRDNGFPRTALKNRNTQSSLDMRDGLSGSDNFSVASDESGSSEIRRVVMGKNKK